MALVGDAISHSVLPGIVLAFGVTFVFGWALERGLIRFLYKRPLESLLDLGFGRCRLVVAASDESGIRSIDRWLPRICTASAPTTLPRSGTTSAGTPAATEIGRAHV